MKCPNALVVISSDPCRCLLLFYLSLPLRIEVQETFKGKHLLANALDVVQLFTGNNQLHASIFLLQDLDPLSDLWILTLDVQCLGVDTNGEDADIDCSVLKQNSLWTGLN